MYGIKADTKQDDNLKAFIHSNGSDTVSNFRACTKCAFTVQLDQAPPWFSPQFYYLHR